MATIILRKKKVKGLPPKKHEPITIVVMANSVGGDDRCERCGDYFDGLEAYEGRLVCCGCAEALDEEAMERGEKPVFKKIALNPATGKHEAMDWNTATRRWEFQ